VLGAEKGRDRVWGAVTPTRDGRVWGAPAPAQDGADWGRRRTDVEGQPGRGRDRGFGERRRRHRLSRALRRGGRCVFSFLVLLDRPSADVCGTSGVGTVRSGGARGKARHGVKARRWTGKGEPMELSYFHSF
jgi:hypothetical protein